MANINSTMQSRLKHVRTIAHSLMLLWAGWWIFFGFSSGLSEGMTPMGVLFHTAMPGFIFLLTTAVAWRWEDIGGKLLTYEGLLILFIYPVIAVGSISFGAIFFVILTMALPPLLAGFLLRTNWQKL